MEPVLTDLPDVENFQARPMTHSLSCAENRPQDYNMGTIMPRWKSRRCYTLVETLKRISVPNRIGINDRAVLPPRGDEVSR
jgi:hypothetical protein